MSKPKRLSGNDVIAILEGFGFSVSDQRGSHVKLCRSKDGVRQTLTIPDHKELDKGTTVALFKQAARYIPETELRPHFYTQ